MSEVVLERVEVACAREAAPESEAPAASPEAVACLVGATAMSACDVCPVAPGCALRDFLMQRQVGDAPVEAVTPLEPLTPEMSYAEQLMDDEVEVVVARPFVEVQSRTSHHSGLDTESRVSVEPLSSSLATSSSSRSSSAPTSSLAAPATPLPSSPIPPELSRRSLDPPLSPSASPQVPVSARESRDMSRESRTAQPAMVRTSVLAEGELGGLARDVRPARGTSRHSKPTPEVIPCLRSPSTPTSSTTASAHNGSPAELALVPLPHSSPLPPPSFFGGRSTGDGSSARGAWLALAGTSPSKRGVGSGSPALRAKTSLKKGSPVSTPARVTVGGADPTFATVEQS